MHVKRLAAAALPLRHNPAMARVETWGPVPLSADEIERACAIVQASRMPPDGVRFVWAAVAEGAKGEEVRRPARGGARLRPAHRHVAPARRRPRQRARIVRARHRATTCSRRSSTRSTRSPARSSAPTPTGRRRWRSAASPTSTSVQVDPWATGNFGVPWEDGPPRRPRHVAVARRAGRQRLRAPDRGRDRLRRPQRAPRRSGSRTTAWCRSRPTPAATTPSRTARGARRCSRSRSCRPEGPSFTLDGNAISWDCWRLAATMHPVDGLVLHDVAWVDDGAVRPIMKRASLAEMIVPYGDVAPDHGFKHVMDVGEYGFGHVRELARARLRLPGRDPLPRRALRAARRRHACTTRNAICIHEEDCRDPLEALRTTSRARARCAAAAGSWSRRSTPSATTSTASSGTSTSTARSSSR